MMFVYIPYNYNGILMLTEDQLKLAIDLNGIKSQMDIAKLLGVKLHEFKNAFKAANIEHKKVTQSKETRDLRSENMKNRHTNLEYKNKSVSGLLTKNSDMKGKKIDDIYGQELANKIKKKISIANTGKIQTDETKSTKNTKLKGQTRTAAQKQNISKARLAGFANGTITLSPLAGNGKGGYRDDIGHYVRSTYEHKFAQALIHMGIPYAYEKYKYIVTIDGVDCSYTPDFVFNNLTIDIKNSFNAKDEQYLKKVDAMLELHGIIVITVIGDGWKELQHVVDAISCL